MCSWIFFRPTIFGLWLIWLCVVVPTQGYGQAGAAYQSPPGGWTYLFSGDAANGLPRRTPGPALDGTWDHEVGSDEWNGDGRGLGNGPKGGVETAAGILTIEDAETVSSGTNNNRKIYFIHALGQDGVTNNSLLDTGVTLSFRARLTPTDAKSEIAMPNGYGIFSGGQGMFGLRQKNPGGIISFSLVNSVEDAGGANLLNFTSEGLTMNRLNGDSPTNSPDSTATASQNPIVPLDPTVLHEFWITIRSNSAAAGNGTHEVNVYVDGNLTPTTFNVTAGTSSNTGTNNQSTNYLALGLNQSVALGAFDTDFFAYKPGVIQPVLPAIPDNFESRAVISGSSILFSASNVGATKEAGEPQHSFVVAPLYKSLWYTWTAPYSGGVVIQAASDFDIPIVAVYTGNSLDSLTKIADDASTFSYARVAFTAVAGQSYQIAVDGGSFGNPGEGNLNISLVLSPPPANDLFADRQTIAGNYFGTSGSFLGASRETGETNHGAAAFGQTLWWSWTAPTDSANSTVPVRLMADAVSFAPVIGVYTGNSLAALTPVPTVTQTNGFTNAMFSMTRTATFTATPGTTYQIALAGQQHDPIGNVISPRYGGFRFRLNVRALSLSVTDGTTTGNFDGSRTFTGVARVSNLGPINSHPLRLRVSSLAGVGVQGQDSGYAVNEQVFWSTNGLGSVAPGQTVSVNVSGTIPAKTQNILPDGSGTGVGYGAFVQLEEQPFTNAWFTVDQVLAGFDDWPALDAFAGPGGGVIRLDPDYVGFSTLDPLTSVALLGLTTVLEGSSISYTGRAVYLSGASFSFTKTAWSVTNANGLTARFTITTNGVLTVGNITSNVFVTLTAPYSNGCFLYLPTTGISVNNLPPPLLTAAKFQTNKSFTFTISGVSGRSNLIEATTNLTPPIAWANLATNVLDSNGRLNFTNSFQTNLPSRFFRAREL